MLEETADELFGRHRAAFDLVGGRFFVRESHPAVAQLFEATATSSITNPGSQIAHDPVDGRGAEVFGFDGHVGIDAGRRGRAVAEPLLDQPQVDARFEQVRGPGVAQRMDRSPFMVAARFQGRASNQTQALPGLWETNDSVSRSIGQIVQFGLSSEYYSTYANNVLALSLPDLNMAAGIVVKPDSLVWVIVGDRAKIEKGIRELNIGEVQVIDTDGNPVM